MRIASIQVRAGSLLKRLAVVMFLAASIAYASDLVFLMEAVNPGNGKTYKAYIDRSTIQRVGTYQQVKLISIYPEPITASGYEGVKSMVNTFQVDCARHVKRVTYIALLNSQGDVIVDEKYPDAADEGFGDGTVDTRILPYLCPSPEPR